MNVSYYRSGGGRSGIAENEWLSVSGDDFRAWRSIGVAAGHFGGRLTADEATRLRAALAACEAAEPAHPAPPWRDAATVQVDIESMSVRYGSGTPPGGPWTALDAVLHELCDAIVDRPTAAIAIVPGDGGFELVHRGRDPIAVDLTDARFVAITRSGGGQVDERSTGAIEGAATTAGPGWGVTIPVGSRAGPDTIHVRLTIGAGHHATRVEVAHTCGPAPPG